MNQTQKDLCKVAVGFFGINHQKMKAVEEMGELITVLGRETDKKVPVEDVITEIADATIMLQQLSIIYGQDKIDAEIERKLDRLKERIKHCER